LLNLLEFGIILSKNNGAKFTLNDVHILQQEAYDFYFENSSYAGPVDPSALYIKKYTPFDCYLLNVYKLNLTNVKISSLSYLLSKEIPIVSNPFRIEYDSPVSSIRYDLTNVVFEDLAFEDQTIFEVKEVDFGANDPSVS
jgi:hypothetical protein